MSEALERRVTFVEAAVAEIRDAVNSIKDSFETLVRLEERNAETKVAIERSFKELHEIDERLRKIEVILPGLQEIRTWVVGGVLSTVSVVGSGVVALVLK
jgi:hypothetical protein